MLMLLLKESIRSPREVLGANMKVRVTRCLSIVSMGVRQIVRGLGCINKKHQKAFRETVYVVLRVYFYAETYQRRRE